MNKRVALLLCSTAALLTFNAAGQAAPAEPSPTVPPAQSYADLLAPIPNAVEMLRTDDAAQVARPRLQLAQYHHHHHHHHYHHHHHHSFFPGAVIGGIIGGALAAPPPYYAEHCYWTRGRPYWNGYRWVHPRVRVCD